MGILKAGSLITRVSFKQNKSPQNLGAFYKGDDTMFWEYIMDVSFVWIALVGSIIALVLVYAKGSSRRRAR